MAFVTVSAPPLVLASMCGALAAVSHWWLSVPACVGAVIFLADAVARYKDWKCYRALLAVGGFRPALLRRYRASYCGRHMTMCVDDPDTSQAIRDYYFARGYRWWHILPDGTPWVFMRANFWRRVLGVSNPTRGR